MLITRFAVAIAVGSVSSTALAQHDFPFVENQAQSNFVWSGTTSIGAIVGNPSNAFQLSGGFTLSIAPVGAQSVGSASFVSGDVAVVPDIHGKIPNPISFLPPLATIDVVNLHLSPSSSAFSVAANGAFSADLVLTALSGTMTVTQITGGQTVTDLTNLSSSPSATSGTISSSGANLHLNSPVNSTFPFSDPTSGISGSITLVGTIVADWTHPSSSTYCTAKVNSQGCTPAIAFSGTPSYSSASPFALTASNVLNNKAGLLFYGSTAANTSFQGGTLCIKLPITRTLLQTSGGNPPPNDCSGTYSLDFNAYTQTFVDPNLTPGATVYAQYWSRDPGFAAPNNTGLTDAARFTIAP